MWERLTSPDILIFLDVSFEESMKRRKQNWSIADYQEQHHRLRHARQHANLYVDTTALSPGEVLQQILQIRQRSIIVFSENSFSFLSTFFKIAV